MLHEAEPVAFLFFTAGAAIVLITVLDIFQAVLVPRPTGGAWRPSSMLIRLAWGGWGVIAHRISAGRRREDYLGAFAPTMLIALLISWILALVVGYGSMFFALREHIRPPPTFGEALYFAGTTLLTIGYGDFVPAGGGVRFLSLVAGGTGLGAFAIITAFLFAVFGSYQQREAFVVMFGNRAGAPPSTIDMIATHAELDIVDGLLQTIRDSQIWIAQVHETHLAYPILTFFRSTHDDVSWIAVIGTILDASTLAITTFDIATAGEAIVVNRLARRFVSDFSAFFRLKPVAQIGIDRIEFDTAYDRLQAAGLPLRDRDRAWEKFAEMRSTYAGHLNLMAQFWRIPPAHWIGDRSFLPAALEAGPSSV